MLLSNPLTARLTFVEDDGIIVAPKIGELKADEIKKRHWIHLFDGRLQFAQAYVSPNWYQGGSNNLTMLVNLNFDVKLNRNYHRIFWLSFLPHTSLISTEPPKTR